MRAEQIRTSNMLERVMREIRRRTRVVGAFPDGRSALMLAAARLRHVAGSRWGTRRYMDMDWLKEMQTESDKTGGRLAYSNVALRPEWASLLTTSGGISGRR